MGLSSQLLSSSWQFIRSHIITMKGPDCCNATSPRRAACKMPSEDFSEYLWMADELEDFDRKVEFEFWEECFIEMCIEEMLQEEEVRETKWYFTEDDEQEELEQFMCYTEELMRNALNLVVVSKLNPNA